MLPTMVRGSGGPVRRWGAWRALRLAVVLRAAYPRALGVGRLGATLPWAAADRLLTVGLLAAAIYLPLLCWAAGAHRLMRGYLAALLSGAAVVAVILSYSPFLQACCVR